MNPLRRALHSAPFVLLLAACAAPTTPSTPRWEKSGATEAQVAQALQECLVEGRVPASARVGADTGTGTAGIGSRDRQVAEDEAMLLQSCMRAKGFRQVAG
jgi:hypothetical protein